MEIHRISMGPFTSCFVVRGAQGFLLIDTGLPNRERRLLEKLDHLGIEPQRIRLIVATHGHADHVGCLRAVKDRTTALVAIHRADSHLLRHGLVVVPPPITTWGRTLALVLRAFRFLGRFEAVEPEIEITEPLGLAQYGITGRIIPTPGHTAGSLSVVLEEGQAFVGDLAVNSLPLGLGLGVPALAENVGEIFGSWERLLSAGATTIYPAHGKPFPADCLRKKLERIKGEG